MNISFSNSGLIVTIEANQVIITRIIDNRAYTIEASVASASDVVKAYNTFTSLKADTFIDFAKILQASKTPQNEAI